jgi:hypothetical protein
MKKILFSVLVVPFIIIPALYAITIPLIDFLVPPSAPASSFNLHENNGIIAIWGGILVYYAFYFLIACWVPYCLIQNVGKKSRIVRSMATRWVMLAGLQVLPIVGKQLNQDFFKYGNSDLKWGCFYLITGLLLTFIPIRWLYLNSNLQVANGG